MQFGPVFNSVSEDCASFEKIDNPGESDFDLKKENGFEGENRIF